jgi:hypothetical protein
MRPQTRKWGGLSGKPRPSFACRGERLWDRQGRPPKTTGLQRAADAVRSLGAALFGQRRIHGQARRQAHRRLGPAPLTRADRHAVHRRHRHRPARRPVGQQDSVLHTRTSAPQKMRTTKIRTASSMVRKSYDDVYICIFLAGNTLRCCSATKTSPPGRRGLERIFPASGNCVIQGFSGISPSVFAF